MIAFAEGIKRKLVFVDIPSRYRSAVNADGSIDVEIRVPVGDRDPRDLMLDISEAANWTIKKPWWIMGALIMSDVQFTGSPSIDKKPHRTWTHAARFWDKKTKVFGAPRVLFTMREQISNLSEYLSKKGKFKEIIIRLHWSPTGKQPKRPGR